MTCKDMKGLEQGRVASYLTGDGRYLYILFRIERDSPEFYNYPVDILCNLSTGEESGGKF